jgi:chorismate-pyruvate lyase
MAASDASILAPLAGFYAAAGLALPVVETVGYEDVPLGLRALLSAPRPLTPRLEALHGEPLALRVLERRRHGDVYGRRVVLVRGDGVPVVLAAIEIDLTRLAPAIRDQVLAEVLPFGHILAGAVARPDALLRVACDPFIAVALALPIQHAWLYGRRRILVDGERATVATIVEILAPESPSRERASHIR